MTDTKGVPIRRLNPPELGSPPGYSQIVEVRGIGLWIAVELKVPARPLCEALQKRGVLCKETHSTVIRLAPPLVISKKDLDWGLDQIEAVLIDC